MGKTQTYSGNPEQKLVWLTDNFVGGVNLTYSDDTTSDSEFRKLWNFDLDSRGSIEKRKGYTKNNALSELLYPENLPVNMPMFWQDLPQDQQTWQEIVLFKFIENTNNAWTVLSDYPTLQAFQDSLGAGETCIIETLTIANGNPSKLGYPFSNWFVNRYTIPSSPLPIERFGDSGVLPLRFNVTNNLMDVFYGEDFNKIYLTNNHNGLVMYDKKTRFFSYSTDLNPGVNSAYKPNSLEIRKVGFNVLGDDPLSWIDSSTLTTHSIQGIYLTTMDRIPVLKIPTSYQFQVNIIYTGSDGDFTITLKDTSKEENNEITATKNKNTGLSKPGLSVYDVVIQIQPTSETEIDIKFSNTGIQLSPYRDYYEIGNLDPTAKPVSKLNVGSLSTVEIAQRLVYYGGNTIWFSEINRYDYIPNYNYVLLPIANTDSIVRIIFFRKNYIIFTKQEIWRMDGTFGNNDFGVYPINNTVGCLAPHSVKRVGDTLIFLSQIGLRGLEYDRFLEGLQNVKELDEKVKFLTYKEDDVYGVMYEDQYWLLNNLRGKRKFVNIQYQEYQIPDAMRYYYSMKSFVFDVYGDSPVLDTRLYPHFLFSSNGRLFTFMNLGVYRYGGDYKDFNQPYVSTIETSGINCNYPLHKKKFKNIILKATGGELAQPIYAKVYGDGTLVYDSEMGIADINELGEVIYEIIETPATTLPPTIARLGTAVLGDAKLGYNPIVLRKLKLPLSCKNVTISLESRTDQKLSILALGYTFKLGKVKEK